jgi:hypothetical protein
MVESTTGLGKWENLLEWVRRSTLMEESKKDIGIKANSLKDVSNFVIISCLEPPKGFVEN